MKPGEARWSPLSAGSTLDTSTSATHEMDSRLLACVGLPFLAPLAASHFAVAIVAAIEVWRSGRHREVPPQR
jgi:hypothetical protein